MDKAILSKASCDFLECTICSEPFKDPKVLSCFHTFCEGCLEKILAEQGDAKETFPCPTCRADTALPEDGVAGLKINFFVQSLSATVQAHKSLVSKEEDNVQCDNCEEEVASQGCVVCEEFLCDECACGHRRGKRTRSHGVVGVAELKEQLITKTGSLKSESLPICPKHQDEMMKLYCETCKYPICRDCWVLQHKDHKYGYLADAVGNVRAEIKDKLEAARLKIAEYQDKASAVIKKQAELDASSKKVADDIDSAVEEEIKPFSGLVRSKQSELKEKLASITAARSKQLSATADSVETTLGCLSSTVDFSQKVMEHGSDFDIMNVYSNVTTRLQSLLERSTPDIPDSISYIMFEPRKKEKVVVLGNIFDEEMQEKKMEEEEDSHGEGTFHFTVENISKLNWGKFGPPIFIRNLPWKILASPEHDPNTQINNNSNNNNNNNNKSLGVYLQCDADSSSLWSCRASAELRLVPQNSGVETYTRKFQHVFYSNENNWGFPDFMPWHEVCDPQKGYIKDDKIILEAYLKADTPRGEKEVIVGNNDDQQIQEDKLQTEATFRFTVDSFSKVMVRSLSPVVFIRNLPWKIVARPSHDSKSKPPHNDQGLAVGLLCDVNSSSLWSCHASVELRLIPQKNGVQTITKKFDKIYYSKERDWGYEEFMPWHEVCDPQKGYIKDDKIILEAYVKADAPHGMKELIIGKILSKEVPEEMEEGELQTHATFCFIVENFSNLNENKLSPATFIRNLPWRIMVRPEYDSNAQPPNNKNLGVYLHCDADSNSLWSCRASVELRLIPQKTGVQTLKGKFDCTFYRKENTLGRGYNKFMPWHEVCDPKKGYIKDDKIVLQAYVKADAPRIMA
ncbi:USP7 [Branchiostoma lanceolatum]|uniref:USP7 protein n=1 Tax=Branchiostoma lanceolatum TaxID=7740 RepID=A0A8J9ZAT3_BRALA|nr:USP7 [Branchiostoma lanceolatum]